ncbi:hypothetical protein EIP91_000748 [Steccherinum ochraceum]|uniref:Ubiquitin-like domain-containing protein n=1 Tax=Steccherinum ochraceum TaxID=92696 RepID=A0A4R0RNQ4_9APHY|nr:hypothetical protein EIP91_000748 [Steccherinum ochraceum]
MANPPPNLDAVAGTLTIKYRMHAVMVATPSTYDDARDLAYIHFPALEGKSLVFRTTQLGIGAKIEIAECAWELVRDRISCVEVADRQTLFRGGDIIKLHVFMSKEGVGIYSSRRDAPFSSLFRWISDTQGLSKENFTVMYRGVPLEGDVEVSTYIDTSEAGHVDVDIVLN